jgi:histidinol phosphatase-like enzyme
MSNKRGNFIGNDELITNRSGWHAPRTTQRTATLPTSQDQRIILGADIAIRAYKDDWIIVGITNQGGVAAGHKSMQECIKEQQYTLELFPQLREIYLCPDFEGRKCFRVTPHNVHNHSQTKWSGQYRKPRSGMLQLAMVRHKHTPAKFPVCRRSPRR